MHKFRSREVYSIGNKVNKKIAWKNLIQIMNINHKKHQQKKKKKRKKISCFHKMKKIYQIRKTLFKTHEKKKLGC